MGMGPSAHAGPAESTGAMNLLILAADGGPQTPSGMAKTTMSATSIAEAGPGARAGPGIGHSTEEHCDESCLLHTTGQQPSPTTFHP